MILSKSENDDFKKRNTNLNTPQTLYKKENGNTLKLQIIITAFLHSNITARAIKDNSEKADLFGIVDSYYTKAKLISKF